MVKKQENLLASTSEGEEGHVATATASGRWSRLTAAGCTTCSNSAARSQQRLQVPRNIRWAQGVRACMPRTYPRPRITRCRSSMMGDVMKWMGMGFVMIPKAAREKT